MRVWLLGLFSSLLLAGCGGDNDSHRQQLAQKSLLYCISNAPLSFNPQLVMSSETLDATAHQLYNRLLRRDPNNQQLIPALASQWQQDSQGLRYRFTLRKAVPFHETAWFSPSRMLTADDVAFTFNRIINKQHPYHAIGGGRYPFFSGINWTELVREIRVLGPHQVEFVLTRPDADFLSYLATDYASILSAEYGKQLQENGTPAQIDKQPVGTGPFMLQHYRPDEFIRYQRHNNYWDGPPALQQLVFDITPQSSKRLAKLLSGECDAMANPSASQVSMIKQDPSLAVSEAGGINVSLLALNTQKAPFNDIRVRKALSLALSRQDILQAVYFNEGRKATTLLPARSWAHSETQTMPDTNMARARWLLKQAGVDNSADSKRTGVKKNNKPFINMTLLLPAGARSYNPDGLKTGQLIQQRFATLGIKVILKPMDEQLLSQQLQDGSQDAVLTGWSADTPSPDNTLRNLLSCHGIANTTNASRWCHPVFEQQLDLALTEPVQAKRRSHYQLAQMLAYQDVAVIPLIHSQRLLSYRRNITGLALLPYGGVAFDKAYKE
ncbi:ABC transporter substrate-binding protein [Oceanisphaera pacifica]|uniref:ABC transporter substrate-binding protein n=1 Tax=Oceanisphaera pacifica TaxID=2818389 RepID=A0ABS3NDR0_9GAMM|nr:ABC transporter substrate-binding protein [Oceanisphaera pacifica]MBO1518690.1 ABC transporter substrate-binding protein [Oceanisphaera pacifica]